MRIVPLLAALLLFGACTPPTVSSGGPGPQQACADDAYNRCSHLQTCSPTGVLHRYGSESVCQTTFEQYCEALLAAPSTGSTPAGIETCAQAISNWSCADYVTSQNAPPECKFSTGPIANGGPCAFPGQCQSSFCAIPPGSPCGTCAPAPRAGDSCAQLASCGPGFTCTTDTQQCEVAGGQGAPCGTGAPCRDDMACVGSVPDAGTPGTCQADVTTQGAPCTSPPGCYFYGGLTCDPGSKQCAPIQLAPAGQPCGLVGGQQANCLAGECEGNSGPTPGTCVTYPQLGQACDIASGPICMPPGRCIVGSGSGTAGTCAVPDGTACH
jgi:hypothetical protein